MNVRLFIKNIVAISFAFISVLRPCFAGDTSISSDVFTICYEDQDYPPYVFTDKDNGNQHSGILVEIIALAAEKTELPIEFIRRPWSRCQKLVSENKAQALFAMIKTPEREQLYAFPADNTNILLKVNYPIFFQKKGAFDNPQVLIGLGNGELGFNVDFYQKHKLYGLAAPMGYVVEQFIKDQSIASSYLYTLDEGLHAVSIGRLDGYVVERLIGQYSLASNGLESLVFSSDVIVKQDNWYVPFNNDFYIKNAELVQRFWQNVTLARDDILSTSPNH